MTRPQAPSVCSQKKVPREDVKWTQFGHFLVPSDLEKVQRLRLFELMPFWTQEALKRILLPIILQQSPISRRNMNWLVTNYSKKYSSTQIVMGPQNRLLLVNIHEQYNSWQAVYKRRLFDMFNRRGGGRVRFWIYDTTADGRKVRTEYNTCVAQLNFFFWAERYGVLNYALANIDDINNDMKQNNTEAEKRQQEELQKPPAYRKKRHELSQRPAAACEVVRANLVLDFRPGQEC